MEKLRDLPKIIERKPLAETGTVVGSPSLNLNLLLQPGWVSPPGSEPHEKTQVHLDGVRYSRAF